MSLADISKKIAQQYQKFEKGRAAPLVVGGGLIPGGSGSGAVDDTTEQASWSSQDPRFYGIRDLIIDQSGLDIFDTQASRILNDYGETFAAAHSGRWPTYTDVRADQSVFTSLARSALRTDLLPPTYGVRNADGSVTYYDNTGALPVETSAPEPLWQGTYAETPGAVVYGADEYASIINWDAAGGRGRGSGSGGGRSGQVFDRAELDEYITRSWSGLMLETPPAGVADRWIAASNAFWSEGGSLDIETWLKGEMRKTARYQTLYGRKDPLISEEEHLGQYLSLARQTGLRSEQVNREAARGAAGGGAPASFAASLVENADVQGLGTGELSRRFAQTVGRLPA